MAPEQTLEAAMEEAYAELVAANEEYLKDPLAGLEEPPVPPDVEERRRRNEAEDSGFGHLHDPVR